jgi:hypothetical protein
MILVGGAVTCNVEQRSASGRLGAADQAQLNWPALAAMGSVTGYLPKHPWRGRLLTVGMAIAAGVSMAAVGVIERQAIQPGMRR